MFPSPVYLDNNATTPLDPEVISAVSSALSHLWGNPSSRYGTGRQAAQAVKTARSEIGEMIGAAAEEITFTSGGTESNHLAIWSAVDSYWKSDPGSVSCPPKVSSKCHPVSRGIPHIVTTNIEHPAIDLPLSQLESRGLVCVTRVPVVPGTCRVTVQEVLDAVTPDTCLVTIMMANNETGVIQPVQEIFSQIRACPPKTRVPLLLHSDAAQSVGKIKVSVTDLSCDLLTIVGHKFYGPRVGCLYHRDGCQVSPVFYGGGQEGGLRPGTENTPMIVGLGVAARLVTNHLVQYQDTMKTMRNYLVDQLIKNFNLVQSDQKKMLGLGEISWRYVDMFTLPNTLSVRFGGFTGHQLLVNCRDEFEASTSAACHSGGGVSKVLTNSFTYGDQGARETIRMSVGRETTKEQIDRVVTSLRKAVDSKCG